MTICYTLLSNYSMTIFGETKLLVIKDFFSLKSLKFTMLLFQPQQHDISLSNTGNKVYFKYSQCTGQVNV